MPAGQQLVDDAAQREHVISGIRIQTVDHFRACIGRSHRAQRIDVERRAIAGRLVGIRYCPGNPEVDDLDATVRQHDDVRGLQVGMDDTLAVRELQRGDNLPEYRQQARQRRTPQPVPLQNCLQRGPLEQLHRQEQRGAVPVEVMYSNDIGMGEALGLARLPLQDLQRVLALQDVDIQGLYRDIGMSILRLLPAQVARLEHRAHAARADARLDDEPARQYVARLQRLLIRRRPGPFGDEIAHRLPAQRKDPGIEPAARCRIPDPSRLRSPVIDQSRAICLRAFPDDAIHLGEELVLAQSPGEEGFDRRCPVHMRGVDRGDARQGSRSRYGVSTAPSPWCRRVGRGLWRRPGPRPSVCVQVNGGSHRPVFPSAAVLGKSRP